MSSTWGNSIKYTIFGESHGEAIGIVVDGLTAGFKIDLEEVEFEMKRRAPGTSKLVTKRKEKDKFEIVSGIFDGRTNGAPLCALIGNINQTSADYEKTKNIIRAGHADYPAFIKHNECNDYRGGGHFSGRITAPIVFAGAVAKQILRTKEIAIGSHILQIGSEKDVAFDSVNVKLDDLDSLKHKKIPTIELESAKAMEQLIIKIKQQNDSVGGIIETAVINLPVGLGEPFFDSLESQIAHLVFSIPGVKGIEFGLGFGLAEKKGSEIMDEFYIDNDCIKTYHNNNGGVLGGLSTGMPLLFKVVVKPTSSIKQKQRTVDVKVKSNTEVEIVGRHDPCIILRTVPVVEAMTAMAILDLV
ncbi:MAG: chorismate synthase [Alkaliphilus sp.]|nr:chorismate synthase [bacterium AH-315-L21]PHS33397.1 MAG: chorismate synthase [Alkaliphilus sp.]